MFRRKQPEEGPDKKTSYLHRLVYNITDDLPELEKEKQAAAKEFFGPGPLVGDEMEVAQATGRMMEWFIFDRVVKKTGKVPLEMWLEAMWDRLSEEEREIYAGYRDHVYSMFEILEVRRGEGLKVRDHFTDKIYEVQEKRGSLQVRKGLTLIARVLPFGDAYMFSGVNILLPRQLTRALNETLPFGIDSDERLDPLDMERIIFGRETQPKRERRAPQSRQPRPRIPAWPSGLPPGLDIPDDLEEQVERALERHTEGALTLAALKRKISETEDFNDYLQWVMKRVALEPEDERELQHFLDLMLKLWNATPREEFGGRSPAEALLSEHPELIAGARGESPRRRKIRRLKRRKRRR